jgi:hypothetical protein
MNIPGEEPKACWMLSDFLRPVNLGNRIDVGER